MRRPAPRGCIGTPAVCLRVRRTGDAAPPHVGAHPDVRWRRSALCVCHWPAARRQNASTSCRRRALLADPVAAWRRLPQQPAARAFTLCTAQLTPSQHLFYREGWQLPRACCVGDGDCPDPLRFRRARRCATVALPGTLRPSARVFDCVALKRACSAGLCRRVFLSTPAAARRGLPQPAGSQAFTALTASRTHRAAFRAVRLPAGRACPRYPPAVRAAASTLGPQPRTHARGVCGDRRSFTCPVRALRLTGVPSGAGRRARALVGVRTGGRPHRMSLSRGSFECRARRSNPTQTNQGAASLRSD